MSDRDKDVLWLEPQHLALTIPAGATVAQALSQGGSALNQPCGGRGKCGKCLVRIEGAAAPTAQEEELLSPERLAAGWRLACLSPARPGLRVSLPQDQEQGLRILGGETDPETAAPGLGRPQDGYKLACDIGTTTVVLYLLHPQSGAVLHTASALNGQIAFGGDVISRIFSVCEDYQRLQELQAAIVRTLNQLIARILDQSGLERGSIRQLGVAGNTTMEHLLLGADPRGLGKSPFIPAFLAAPASTAAELGLDLDPATEVWLAPNLSAFVGGDITAGIYYTGLARQEELTLLLDIGTNNEMVIGNCHGLFACSAAAGPALEGAQISTGMRAAAGAVEKVRLDSQGGLQLQTVGQAPPQGLCGSGLIDLLALLVREGAVRPDGRFAQPGEVGRPDLSQRLRPGGKRHQEFVYCRQGELGAERDLVLTQKDVREAQLAKSAIAVGIDKLLERLGLAAPDLHRVYLAGAFGNYIDQKNAMELGLLPRVAPDRVEAVRNAAGQGVCRALFDPQAQQQLERISRLCQPLNLAAEDDFQQRFLARLQLGD